jgi:Tol biopolymer transport system component
MMPAEHLSYASLAAARAALSADEAVALVLAAACTADTVLPGGCALPPPEQMLLSSTGDVWFSGAGEQASERAQVAQLAALLRHLLGLAEVSGDERHVRAPGALTLLLARAAGDIDLPAPSYAAFREALQRFEPASSTPLSSIYWRCARQQAGSEPAAAEAPPQSATVLPFPEARQPQPAARPERRTRGPNVSDLRRELREADIRLYQALQRNRRSGLRRLMGGGGAVAAALLLATLALPIVLDRPSRAEPDAWMARDSSADAAPIVRETPETAVGAVADVAGGTPAPAETMTPPRPLPTSQMPDAPDPRRVDRAAQQLRMPPPAAVSAGPLLSSVVVGADVFSPSFAADGREILFHAGRDRAALMRAAFDDGQPSIRTLLNDGAANYHATLSPDGQWIAYDSDRDGTRGVFVARADGADSRRVSGDGYAAVPSWSFDGTRLAFIRAEPARQRVWNVWVADLEAGTLTRVSRHRVGQAWGGSWFPDGEHIAYSVEDTLVIAGLQNGTTRVVRSPRPGRLIRTPAVSPDGNWIVFQVHRDGAWLFDVSTGAMQRLLGDAAAEQFAWSPDGRRVVYHTRRGGAWSVWQLEWDSATSG